uniref:Uncharacterized protein n=1 Tax=Vespula pensylvanica TaxID=30213 RepID=A0A834JV40_VESPE|nr:hypothetical protein H0235_016777 [Vespula pensylvanica]
MKEKTEKRRKRETSKRQCEDYRLLVPGSVVVSPLFSALSLRRSRSSAGPSAPGRTRQKGAFSHGNATTTLEPD